MATTYKSLKGRNKFNKLAKAFFTFFHHYLRNPAQLATHLHTLQKKLEVLRASPEDNVDFEYYDFCLWCERKLASSLFPPGTVQDSIPEKPPAFGRYLT